jgi:hypothetical protein
MDDDAQRDDDSPQGFVNLNVAHPARTVGSVEELASESGLPVYAPHPWPARITGQPRYGLTDEVDLPGFPGKSRGLGGLRAGIAMLAVTGSERLPGGSVVT